MSLVPLWSLITRETASNMDVWHSPNRLWSSALITPQAFLVYNNLKSQFLKMGRLEDLQLSFRRSVPLLCCFMLPVQQIHKFRRFVVLLNICIPIRRFWVESSGDHSVGGGPETLEWLTRLCTTQKDYHVHIHTIRMPTDFMVRNDKGRPVDKKTTVCGVQ